jgi:selenocysteine-specific elongation factor
MPVVGTAGHVDHGKSTLIRALTGRDPDRWEEEKRRGLTIDLGFAWATLPGGIEVSFVDVPGHERFIKNMLAGVEAIDIALLVVAADEGWAAQSEEHMAVLDLLGIGRGVVALTKVDRVDQETAELARLEIEEKTTGTSIEGAPIVAVSAHNGQGIEELVGELAKAAAEVSTASCGRPRLWIDRSFSITGAGTVVTGTLLDGAVETGMTVGVWRPGARAVMETARIRGLESHEERSERFDPGRRVAVNLAGIDRVEIDRGAMLGLPGQWQPTARFLVEYQTPRYLAQLPDKGAFQIHIGSGAWPLRWRRLEDGLGLCQLTAELCLQVGDRFILRDTGRRAVVGGGRVLDPDPPRRGQALRAAGAALLEAPLDSPDRIAGALLQVRRSASGSSLAAHSGGGRPVAAVAAGDALLHPEEAARLTELITDAVANFHRESPLRPGVPVAQVGSRLGVPAPVVEALIGADTSLELTAGLVRSRQHQAAVAPEEDPCWLEARSRLEAEGLTAPRISDLGLDRELLHALARAGQVVRISDDIAYLPSLVEQLLTVMEGLPEGFSVSDFREAAGISRKYAVPFLEWTDAAELTVRRGDARTYRGPG